MRKRGAVPTGAEVSELSGRLDAALADVIRDAEARGDVAHDLADISYELRQVAGILEQSAASGRMSREDLWTIYVAACEHWPYHLGELRQTLGRVLEPPQHTE